MTTKVLLKKSSVLGKVPLATDLSYGELALNYADGKLYFKDSSNNIKSFTEDSSVVTLSDTQSLSNKTLINPFIEGVLTAKAVGGDEGGQIELQPAATNNLLSGNIAIDINQSQLRIFETGGSNRGVYINLTQAAAGVGTNLLTGSSGTGPDADTLDGFDSSYFLNYNNLLNTPTIPTLVSQLTNDSGYITTVAWDDVTNKPNLVKAAVQWTANHTLADGTRYLIGDVVYDNGNIFVANYDNESLPTSNTTYWTNLGPGNRLNIDGRDIPNITYAQLINKPSIPTDVRDLTDIDGLLNDTFSGSYTDLTNKPFIPTKTSDITNDSGYLIGLDLIGYATESYVSTAVGSKQDTLVSGTNIRSINGQSLLGSGNITISGSGSTSLSGLTDVSIPSPLNGQALIYDTALSRWTAQDVAAGLYTNTANTTTLDPSQVVDSFAKTEFRTVKYIVQATSASEVHSVEVTVMHNDTNVFTTVYNVMFSGTGKLFEISSAVNGTNIDLTVTPLVSGLTVDVTRIGLITRAFTGGFTWPTDLETQTQTEIDLETQSYPTKDLN